MTEKPNYEKATNAAYEVLCEVETTFPNVDVFQIINKFQNIKLITYSDYARRLGLSYTDFLSIAPSYFGFSIRKRGDKNYAIIVYNEHKDPSTIKFTLAHELGHICLRHENDNKLTDKEANCFARNILCPIPIVRELGLQTIYDYTSCFNISEPMAKAAIENSSSDWFYISYSNLQRINDRIYCYMTGCTLAELYCY